MVGDNLYKKALKEAQKKKPDNTLVYELLDRAVQLSNPLATYALGTWYLFGKFVKKNRQKALKLIMKAADENIAEACFDLAIFYEKGIIVKQNKKKAFELYLKAALYGDYQSYYEVGRCYYYGLGIPVNKNLGWIWLDRFEEVSKTSKKKNKKIKSTSSPLS